jgi:glycosyltransferase involved in cell wall biosynthesis
VTCTDSGGPNEFRGGRPERLRVRAAAGAIAAAINALAEHRPRAAAMGEAGREVAARITWDGVIEKLSVDGAGEDRG